MYNCSTFPLESTLLCSCKASESPVYYIFYVASGKNKFIYFDANNCYLDYIRQTSFSQ